MDIHKIAKASWGVLFSGGLLGTLFQLVVLNTTGKSFNMPWCVLGGILAVWGTLKVAAHFSGPAEPDHSAQATPPRTEPQHKKEHAKVRQKLPPGVEEAHAADLGGLRPDNHKQPATRSVAGHSHSHP
jgi:hypothetical protein